MNKYRHWTCPDLKSSNFYEPVWIYCRDENRFGHKWVIIKVWVQVIDAVKCFFGVHTNSWPNLCLCFFFLFHDFVFYTDCWKSMCRKSVLIHKHNIHIVFLAQALLLGSVLMRSVSPITLWGLRGVWQDLLQFTHLADFEPFNKWALADDRNWPFMQLTEL